MRKFIASIVIVGISILLLVSCGGGDGNANGEGELTAYDVIIVLQEQSNFEGPGDCPNIANLKLSLLINEDNISGFAELIEFGIIGSPRDVSGSIHDSSFSLNPFSISISEYVPEEPPPGVIVRPGYLTLNLVSFEGTFLDGDIEMPSHVITGIVSGDVSFSAAGGPDCIGAQFTGEFEGEARTPTGCLSISEYTSVSEYWACPAVAISSLCDGDGWFCGLPAPPPLAGDGYITNLCEAVDCHTIVNCELAPDITNLENGPGLIGNVILQDGSIGEPIYGCSSFSFGY